MQCFEFFGEPSMRVDLCEETIRYSAYREDGVHIGASLVVTPGDANDRTLYAVHRRALDGLEGAPPGDWLTDVEGFPYAYVFSHIVENRLGREGEEAWAVKLFRGQRYIRQTETLTVRAVGESPSGGFRIADHLVAKAGMPNAAPYTCLKIGPFPDGASSFLFRFECHIGGSAYSDLIPEDIETATRRYNVYGPEHIHREIETLDIPRAMADFPGKFDYHVEFFKSLTEDRRLIPMEYSVVAIDNPNCNPARLRCLNMTPDMRDVSGQIAAEVYSHPLLEAIKGRIHWFVCDKPSGLFYLQLSGPMAVSAEASIGGLRP